MKIEFENPNVNLPNEHKSKLLKKGSDLYKKIEEIRSIINYNKLNHKSRRDLHIELINYNDEPKLLVERAKQLENSDVDLTKIQWYNGALVIPVNQIVPNKFLHITIDYFGFKDDEIIDLVRN
jgi:hypothetical protein